MTSNSIRSFAGGLIVAASMCGVAYFSGPIETAQTAEKPSTNEMKSMLASEGYVIHTEEEWKKQLAASKPVKEKTEEETKEPTETKETQEPKEIIKYRAVLSVSSGMTTLEIGKALEQMKIIDNSVAFSNEVERQGLSGDLRPGIYEIESGMSIEEVISAIFK